MFSEAEDNYYRDWNVRTCMSSSVHVGPLEALRVLDASCHACSKLAIEHTPGHAHFLRL